MKNRVKEKEIIPALLNIKEFCDYLGIGETKARELLHDPGNGFTVRIGNRLYAHRGKVDQWLLKQQVHIITLTNDKYKLLDSESYELYKDLLDELCDAS